MKFPYTCLHHNYDHYFLFQILEAIEAGVELVSTNYAQLLTLSGHALVVPLDQTEGNLVNNEERNLATNNIHEINLWDISYKKDVSPLVEELFYNCFYIFLF